MGIKFRDKITSGAPVAGEVAEREIQLDLKAGAMYSSTDGVDLVSLSGGDPEKGGILWQEAFDYSVGDIVTDIFTFYVYVCIIAHTSSGAISSDLSNWKKISQEESPTGGVAGGALLASFEFGNDAVFNFVNNANIQSIVQDSYSEDSISEYTVVFENPVELPYCLTTNFPKPEASNRPGLWMKPSTATTTGFEFNTASNMTDASVMITQLSTLAAFPLSLSDTILDISMSEKMWTVPAGITNIDYSIVGSGTPQLVIRTLGGDVGGSAGTYQTGSFVVAEGDIITLSIAIEGDTVLKIGANIVTVIPATGDGMYNNEVVAVPAEIRSALAPITEFRNGVQRSTGESGGQSSGWADGIDNDNSTGNGDVGRIGSGSVDWSDTITQGAYAGPGAVVLKLT